jgi:uncharacterized membrane protein
VGNVVTERRPSTVLGPAGTLAAVLGFSPVVVVLVRDPPAWTPGPGWSVEAAAFALAMGVSVGAAVLSLFSSLEWSSGRRVRAPRWAYLAMACAVTVCALVVEWMSIDWATAPTSQLSVMLLPVGMGVLGMGVLVIDLVQNGRRA